MAPVDFLSVIERVAAIDTAASWNLGMSNGVLFACFMPAEGAEEVFANGPDVVCAGAFFPPAPAIRVPGGWEVTGRVSFASGCHRADWYLMPIIEIVDGEPVLDPDTGQPSPMAALFAPSQVEVIDTWNTLGMRGTFSADIAVHGAHLPDHLAGTVSPLTSPTPAFSGPLYQMWLQCLVFAETLASLGAARCAVEKLVDLAATKTPHFSVIALRDRPLAQHHAGRAKALIDAARAYLFESAHLAFEDATANGRLSEDSKIACQLSVCHGAQAAVEAVQLVHEATGTSGIRIEAGFERHLRDVLTLTQHASKSVARYESVGQLMFGLPTDWFVLAL
jgi:alkylation response protein AidB-like acyl-CoA dehydrogenase